MKLSYNEKELVDVQRVKPQEHPVFEFCLLNLAGSLHYHLYRKPVNHTTSSPLANSINQLMYCHEPKLLAFATYHLLGSEALGVLDASFHRREPDVGPIYTRRSDGNRL